MIRAVPVYICTRNRNLYPPPPSITTNPDLVNSVVCAHLIHLVQIRSQPAPISGVVASYTPFYAKRDAGDVRFTITDTHTQTELKQVQSAVAVDSANIHCPIIQRNLTARVLIISVALCRNTLFSVFGSYHQPPRTSHEVSRPPPSSIYSILSGISYLQTI